MGRLLRVEHLVPVTAVVIALLVVAAPAAAPLPGTGGLVGSVTAARWTGLGLLAAPALMVYADRWAGAGGALACATGWAVLGVGYGWRDLLPGAYALVAVLVARHEPAPVAVLDRRPLRTPAGGAVSVLLDVPRRVPPRPPRMPAVAVPTAVLAGMLVILAVAGAGQVALGGPEPVLALVVIALGGAVALLTRFTRRRQALRTLFGGPQPVHQARVVDQLGYLHVLVPAADGRVAVEFGINTADTYSTSDGEDDDPRTRPAVLYGDPRPGGWCAAEVDGRLHVPVEPVGAVAVVPYDADHGVPREVSDDEEQLVDPEALIGTDRLTPPYLPREHRIAPVRAWTTTVVIGLGSALAAAEAANLAGWSGTWPAVVTVAVVSAAGFEFGWRTQLRPRLCWHVGGVAAVGFRSRVREPWTVDSAAVHDDEGAVTLTAGDSVLTVATPRPWTAERGQRTGDQLVAGLRASRTQAFAGGDVPPPPLVEVPRRALPLVVAWAVATAGAVALFAA